MVFLYLRLPLHSAHSLTHLYPVPPPDEGGRHGCNTYEPLPLFPNSHLSPDSFPRLPLSYLAVLCMKTRGGAWRAGWCWPSRRGAAAALVRGDGEGKAALTRTTPPSQSLASSVPPSIRVHLFPVACLAKTLFLADPLAISLRTCHAMLRLNELPARLTLCRNFDQQHHDVLPSRRNQPIPRLSTLHPARHTAIPPLSALQPSRPRQRRWRCSSNPTPLRLDTLLPTVL